MYNEQEFFDKLKAVIPDLVKSDNKFSTNDCTSEQLGAYIELKCRMTYYDTLLIEYSKYARLLEEASTKRLVPAYFNATPKGAWGFNLLTMDVEFAEQKNLPATTDFENKDKVTKIVGYLPIEKGFKLWS